MNNSALAIKMALSSLLRNRLRSILTMLGIIIGVASVILILAIGAGAQSLITNTLNNLGTTTITVIPGKSNDSGPPASALGIKIKTLTTADAQAVSQLPAVQSYTGYVNGGAEIVYAKRFLTATVSGVNHTYPQVENHQTAQGRFFSAIEERNDARVVVIADDIKNTLFPLTDPVGRRIRIGNQNFTIIGVLERKGSTLFGNPDTRILIPIGVAQKTVIGEDYLNLLRIRVTDESLVETTKEKIKDLLRFRHQITNPENDDFSVRSVTQALDVFGAVTGALSFFLAAIAAISLLVGGIGITNIMLMTIRERTREIGLRKAIGARPQDIRDQFVLETLVLTGVGGALGIIIGLLGALLVYFIMIRLGYAWTFIFPFIPALVAFFTSIFIGLVFGLYPAKQAANLNPIDALRYE